MSDTYQVLEGGQVQCDLIRHTHRGATRDFGPHENHFYWAPKQPAEKFVMLFYIKLCILMVFLTIIPIFVKKEKHDNAPLCIAVVP